MDPITLGLLILAGTAGTEIGLGGIHAVTTIVKRVRLSRRALNDPRFAEELEQRVEEERKKHEEKERRAEEERKAKEKEQEIQDLIEGGRRAQERDQQAAEDAREKDMDWLSQAADQVRTEPLFSLPLPLNPDGCLGNSAEITGTSGASSAFGPNGQINHDRLTEKANTLVSLLQHMNGQGDQVLLNALASNMDVPLSALQSPYVYVRMAEEMAQRIDLLMLEVFSIASNERDLVVEHAQQTEEREVNYPADRQVIECYRNPDDIPRVIAEHQILLPDDVYFQYLASNQLLVTRDYKDHKFGQILMLCVDVSASMNFQDSRGLPRWVWAAGVTLGLLNKAIIEKSTYFLRFFGSEPWGLQRATNQEEAIVVAQKVIEVMSTIPESRGTDIPAAAYQAINDIRTVPEISFAHILLITDGECRVSTEDLKQALGDKITLNAALIAVEKNSELEAACEVYLNL